MKCISKSEFEELSKADPDYYKNRWEYMSEAVWALEKMIPAVRGVELGHYRFSVIKNGHTIDIKLNNLPDYCLDAKVTPWPIADKYYDTVVAMQVMEYMDNKPAILREIMRIAESAVVTLPYRWPLSADKVHRNIDDRTLSEWFGDKWFFKKIIENSVCSSRRKVMLIFDFTEDGRYKKCFEV